MIGGGRHATGSVGKDEEDREIEHRSLIKFQSTGDNSGSVDDDQIGSPQLEGQSLCLKSGVGAGWGFVT